MGISVITLMEFFEIIVFSIYFVQNSWKWVSKSAKCWLGDSTEQEKLEPGVAEATVVLSQSECHDLTTYVNSYVAHSSTQTEATQL